MQAVLVFGTFAGWAGKYSQMQSVCLLAMEHVYIRSCMMQHFFPHCSGYNRGSFDHGGSVRLSAHASTSLVRKGYMALQFSLC